MRRRVTWRGPRLGRQKQENIAAWFLFWGGAMTRCTVPIIPQTSGTSTECVCVSLHRSSLQSAHLDLTSVPGCRRDTCSSRKGEEMGNKKTLCDLVAEPSWATSSVGVWMRDGRTSEQDRCHEALITEVPDRGCSQSCRSHPATLPPPSWQIPQQGTLTVEPQPLPGQADGPDCQSIKGVALCKAVFKHGYPMHCYTLLCVAIWIFSGAQWDPILIRCCQVPSCGRCAWPRKSPHAATAHT